MHQKKAWYSMLNKNIQFQTIHNDPNLIAHLAPEDRLALHLALLLSSVAALLDRLLAALASILKHGLGIYRNIIAFHYKYTYNKERLCQLTVLPHFCLGWLLHASRVFVRHLPGSTGPATCIMVVMAMMVIRQVMMMMIIRKVMVTPTS